MLVEDRDKIDMLGEFGLEVHSFANMFTVLHNDTLMFMQFQVGDKIAEGDLMRLMVLTVELIISLCLSATSLSKSVHLADTGSLNGSNLATPNETLSQAIASVVLFSIVGLLYILSIAAWFVWLWCKETKVQILFRKNTARGISIAIGGLFYYIGDNLPPLVEEYAEELGCSSNCVEKTQMTGIVMLTIATTTYLPIAINAIFTHNKDEVDFNEDKIPAHIAVFILLAKITDLDLVYTSIERIIPRTCDETIVGGTWAYYIIYLIVFIGVTLYTVLCICWGTTTAEKMLLVINFFLIFLFMACYILADNRLPLGCTGSLVDDRLARDRLKVALLVLTSFISIYSMFMFGGWYFYDEIPSCANRIGVA